MLLPLPTPRSRLIVVAVALGGLCFCRYLLTETPPSASSAPRAADTVPRPPQPSPVDKWVWDYNLNGTPSAAADLRALNEPPVVRGKVTSVGGDDDAPLIVMDDDLIVNLEPWDIAEKSRDFPGRPAVGQTVRVTYGGPLYPTFPAQVRGRLLNIR